MGGRYGTYLTLSLTKRYKAKDGALRISIVPRNALIFPSCSLSSVAGLCDLVALDLLCVNAIP